MVKHKVVFTLLISSLLSGIIFRSIFPLILGKFIDDVIIASDFTLFSAYVLGALGINLISVASSYVLAIASNELSWLAIREIRLEFFENLQNKRLTFFDKTRTGDLIAISTNDIGQLSGMINPGIRFVAEAIVSVAVFLVLGVFSNVYLLALAVPFLLLYLIAVMQYNARFKPIAAVFQQQWADMTAAAQDNITGVRVVRAFSGEQFEIEKFSKVVKSFRKTWIAEQKANARFYPLLILYATIGVSFFAGIAVMSLSPGTPGFTVGTVLGFNGLLAQLVGPTFLISFSINMVQAGLAGGERLFRTMYRDVTEAEAGDEKKNFLSSPINGRIEFKNVNFKYEGTERPVLTNINLTVEPGETVAIVGPTGSGKTALCQLLLRLYEYEGSITIDGIDIRNVSLKDLRHNIGRVEQDVFLFATSIRQNITFGVPNEAEITDEDISRVASIAQIDFVKDLKDGFNTVVGERGVGLSGGQKQRVAIARCLLTSPRVLILDDSTSAIDSLTEEKMALAMDQLRKGRTTFLITHRLFAIRSSSKIVVLGEGRIRDVGNHEELMERSPDYQRIFSRQLRPSLDNLESARIPQEVVIGGGR